MLPISDNFLQLQHSMNQQVFIQFNFFILLLKIFYPFNCAYIYVNVCRPHICCQPLFYISGQVSGYHDILSQHCKKCTAAWQLYALQSSLTALYNV